VAEIINKHILVLGSNGMAGHMIYAYFKNKGVMVTGFDRKNWEINDDSKWKIQILELNSKKHIDIIINCVGILKKESESNKILAIKINALFPHELVQVADSIGSKVIHLSTDCWKDLDTYGRSKRAGELDYDKHLTIRTSIVGPELNLKGSGLFNWFMNQKKSVNGFTKHYWDGVTTLELAKQIDLIIEKDINNIVELRSKDKISKYELLCYFNEVFNTNLHIVSHVSEKVDKTEKKPQILVSKSIKKQILEMKEWIFKNNKIYGSYYTLKN